MGDGTEDNPLTREDVIRLIEENGGTAERLNLLGITFEAGIDLRGLDLRGVILRDAKFPTSFKRDLIEGANLIGVHLEEADLSRAHLVSADLEDTHLEGANLWHAQLERAHLWDTHLEGANLVGTHLGGVNLTRTKFSHDVSLEDADWGNYILDEEKTGDFDSAVASYRHLKAWYTNAGHYDTAGEFFFREMTAKRKAMKWWPNPLNRASSKLISMLCGYGERPSQVVISALVVIFGLAIAYVYGGLSLPYSIYFSAVSFTALGYGSWANTPSSNWVQGLGAFESFLGVFMMALFLVTFTRKMTR